jgi:hypothetical protein
MVFTFVGFFEVGFGVHWWTFEGAGWIDGVGWDVLKILLNIQSRTDSQIDSLLLHNHGLGYIEDVNGSSYLVIHLLRFYFGYLTFYLLYFIILIF